MYTSTIMSIVYACYTILYHIISTSLLRVEERPLAVRHLMTDEIGAPNPQLEPQTASLETCNIN